MDRFSLNRSKLENSDETLTKLDAGSIPSLVENLSDGVLMVDDTGLVTLVNDRFCRLLNYNEGDLKGIPFTKAAGMLFDELSYSWVNTKLQKVFKGKKQFFRHSWKNKQGFSMPVEIEIFPICNVSDEIIGGLFIIKDMHSKLLLEITNTINSTLKLDKMLAGINKSIIDRLGLACNGILILDQDCKKLHMASLKINDSQITDKYSLPANKGLLGQIISEEKPAFLKKLKEQLANGGQVKEKLKDIAGIGYPLVSKGENLGIMVFGTLQDGEFSQIELDLFQSISNQVAMAIYNAKLSNRIVHMSETDGLTGSYNHKFFKKKLQEEIKNAKGNYSVSLLKIDLDNFQEYNDNFGHPAGDKLLIKLAKILQNNMRTQDTVARFGGDEFAIILVNSEPLAALNTAERICQAVERYRFSGRELQPGGKLTISIGIGCYPVHGKSAKALIEKSEKALCEAKKSKNGFIMAD